MYKNVAANKRNTVFIMLGFVLLIAAIGVAFAYYYQDWTIASTVILLATVYALFQYFIASRLAVAMTGAQKIEKKDNPRLYNAVENLTLTAGLPMPEVYIINDPAPNAFAAGRDPNHALVCATTGLIKIMDDKELTAVMAHEVSHIKNYDIRVSTIVFGLVCLVGFVADVGWRMIYYGGRRSRNNDRSLVGSVIMILIIVIGPFAAGLAQMAISREREYLADSSAALLTRYPEGMISALKKLEAQTRPMKQQNPATEAMFITSPLNKESINNLFSTHPPIEKRIERLENGKTKF